jgi:NADH-quinone oxidoreductase subunit L
MEYAPVATNIIVIIGAATAFFAASVGLVQNDIKRVIAYSTCSQLGYMFVAAGLGAYSVAMFHLLTHAFFKAMLFLGAGSVIHAMHHEQDMRNYGGLRKKIPYTFGAMMIGTLAITGVGIPLTHIGFAGFISKDAIIESAYGAGSDFSFWILITAACFTSFYSWRLMFLTFYGNPRGDIKKYDHVHESPTTMLIPLGVLAIGAIFSGMFFVKPFFGDHHKVEEFFGITEVTAEDTINKTYYQTGSIILANAAVKKVEEDKSDTNHFQENSLELVHSIGKGGIFLAPDNHVIEDAHHVPKWVKVSPFLAMIVGFVLAWIFYIKDNSLPRRLSDHQKYIYKFLLNKWYFDEVYEFIFVKGSKRLGKILWIRGDGNIIDGAINGIALSVIPFCSRITAKVQSGFIFHYAFAMILGVLILITWFAIGKGG